VEIFGGIGTGVAAVLEAEITVRRYIHVDNGYAANRAVRHHIQQLLLRYPAQLSTSVILGCCGQLPQDVTMISDEDLRRLGHMDLIIAGWPCQGHSRAGTG
jgi:site-specific DNA-cytosine methylase